jgi:hypothetical protein
MIAQEQRDLQMFVSKRSLFQAEGSAPWVMTELKKVREWRSKGSRLALVVELSWALVECLVFRQVSPFA